MSLFNQIKQLKIEDYVAIEYIDKTRALEILANKVKDRELETNKLKEYENKMKTGKWIISAIELNNKNQLINGQHRLLALINTDKVLPFIVIRGIE